MNEISSVIDEHSTAEGPSRRKQVLLGALTVLALIVVFIGVLPQFADYGEAWESARSMPAGWLAALVAAALVSLVLYSLQWRAPLPDLGLSSAFGVSQVSFMISNGVPGGGAFVLPVQYSMLADEGINRARASAATGVTALWNLLATLMIPLIGLIILVATGSPTTQSWVLIVGGIASFVVVAAALSALVRSEEGARRVGVLAEQWGARVLRVVRKEMQLGWADAILSFRRSTHEMLATRWVPITVAHLLGQLGQFLVLAVTLAGLQRDLEVHTSVAATFFAFGVGRLGMLIPITPGGLGTVDGLLATFLVSFGDAARADALAAVLIWRVFTFVPGLIAGAISFVVWRKRSSTVRSPLTTSEQL